MKKIGILTLSASDNCGSLLQCYALKNLLSKYGDVEVINFSSKSSHEMYDIYPSKCCMKEKVKRFLKRKELYNSKKGYNLFRRVQLEIRGEEYQSLDLHKIADKYDVVVTGSDQVWNIFMSDFDEAFFLNWTKSKKIAYAPSLGSADYFKSNKVEQIKEWLEDFSAISVREKESQVCIEKILNRDIVTVLDPTLVADFSIWDKLIDKPYIDGEYIFYYSWAYCEEETARIVEAKSKKLGIPVYVIDVRKWINNSYSKYGFTLFSESGPKAFLNLMKYAKLCYVESFHGAIFAYILKKDFYLLDTHRSFSDLDPRLKYLMKLLSIEDRVISKFNAEENIGEKIDYFNTKLELYRNKSLFYLDDIFKRM